MRHGSKRGTRTSQNYLAVFGKNHIINGSQVVSTGIISISSDSSTKPISLFSSYLSGEAWHSCYSSGYADGRLCRWTIQCPSLRYVAWSLAAMVSGWCYKDGIQADSFEQCGTCGASQQALLSAPGAADPVGWLQRWSIESWPMRCGRVSGWKFALLQSWQSSIHIFIHIGIVD